MTKSTVAHRRIPSHNRRDEDRVGNSDMTLHHKDLHELPSHTVTMSPSYYTRTGAHTREKGLGRNGNRRDGTRRWRELA